MLNKLFGQGNRRWLAILPALGIVILVLLVKLRPAPALKDNIASSPLVSTTQAKIITLSMAVKGYGRAKPKETWHAVSEVSGRVTYRHDDLKKGRLLPAGTVVLRIDPVDYQLKLAQAKSDLNSAKADAARIDLNEEKQKLSLAFEKNRLAILEKELKRKKNLLRKGSISRSSVDREQSNVLAQQEKVLNLETNVKLIPNDIEVAQARIQVNESRVKEAERRLEKTVVTLPFDARITQVDTALDQVVNQQSILFKANQIGTMEINAQFSIEDMKEFLRQSVDNSLTNDSGLPDIKRLGLQANITLYSGESSQQWTGSVTGVSDSIDPQGNTVGMIVEVANNWKNFDPINSTPVMSDMFLEVQIISPAHQILAVPSKAIHGNKVYVVQDNTLQIKAVQVLFENQSMSAIATGKGINQGDEIITTDLLPAIDGMTVRTQPE